MADRRVPGVLDDLFQVIPPGSSFIQDYSGGVVRLWFGSAGRPAAVAAVKVIDGIREVRSTIPLVETEWRGTVRDVPVHIHVSEPRLSEGSAA